MHTSTHARTHAHTPTHAHTHTRTHAHTHTRTHAHTHTRTYTVQSYNIGPVCAIIDVATSGRRFDISIVQMIESKIGCLSSNCHQIVQFDRNVHATELHVYVLISITLRCLSDIILLMLIYWPLYCTSNLHISCLNRPLTSRRYFRTFSSQ